MAANAACEDVTIDKVEDDVSRRRRLLAESTRVEFSIKAADKAAADTIAERLSARLNQELKALGLPEATTMEPPVVRAITVDPVGNIRIARMCIHLYVYDKLDAEQRFSSLHCCKLT